MATGPQGMTTTTTSSSPLRVPLLSSSSSSSRNGHDSINENSREVNGEKFTDVAVEDASSAQKKSEKNDNDKKLPFETEEGNDGRPARGFFALYRFATWMEICMVLLGVVVAVANGTIQPAQAVLMGRIFGGQAGLDTKVLEDNIHSNMKYLLLGALVSFILNYVQTVCFVVSAERLTRRLKQACFESLLRQEVAFFDMHASGALAHRIEEQSMFISRGLSDAFGACKRSSCCMGGGGRC